MALNDGPKDPRFKALATRIEKALETRGLQKQQFAMLMEVQPSVVTRWLSGHHNFTIETLFKIEDALGFPLINPPDPSYYIPYRAPASAWTYKGNPYYVLRLAKMKIGAAWLPCVVYESVLDGEAYVREREDFREKFAPLANSM